MYFRNAGVVLPLNTLLTLEYSQWWCDIQKYTWEWQNECLMNKSGHCYLRRIINYCLNYKYSNGCDSNSALRRFCDSERETLLEEKYTDRNYGVERRSSYFLLCFAIILFFLLLYIPIYKQADTQIGTDIGWSQDLSRDIKIYVSRDHISAIHEAKNVCPKRGSKTHISTKTNDSKTHKDYDRLFLLIIVCSSTVNFKSRSVIRETWANYTNYVLIKQSFDEIRFKYSAGHSKSGTSTRNLTVESGNTNLNVSKRVQRDLSHETVIVKRGIANLGSYLPKKAAAVNDVKSTEKTDVDKGQRNEDEIRFEVKDSKSLLTEFEEKLLPRYKVIFLLGLPNTANDTDVQSKIDKEAEKYGDIIQEKFIDSYKNLTLKSVMLLKWVVTHCSQRVRYILKTDDDVFVNVVNLERALEQARSSWDTGSNTGPHQMLGGDLICGARPVSDQNDKWYSPRYMYSGRIYPRYLSGGGYVFSEATAHSLYEAALNTPLFHLEDVYITGMCAAHAKPHITPTDVAGFFYTPARSGQDACSFYTRITAHKLPAPDMRRLLDVYKDTMLVDKCERLHISQIKRDILIAWYESQICSFFS